MTYDSNNHAKYITLKVNTGVRHDILIGVSLSEPHIHDQRCLVVCCDGKAITYIYQGG